MGTIEDSDTPRFVDGSVVSKGDRVFIPSEQVQAVVRELIQSPDQQLAWSVNEPGLMFEAKEFGLIFISNEILKEHLLERS